LEDGWQVLNELQGKADAFVYASLMDLCAKLSKTGKCGLKEAQDVIAHMDANGIKGDRFVYNSMLQVQSTYQLNTDR
jgi:hypothetical protein